MEGIDITLIQYMEEELKRTPVEFKKYMYDKILWEDRMIGLVGPRGVGKSTMVKQRILDSGDREKWLYVSADHTYFSNHTITELADTFVINGGKHLVIDEIHKYAGWSRELKQIYDMHGGLQVIFTGSSILDIKKGSADLSRRALVFKMQGLSFREYLSMFHKIDFPVYTLEEILAHKIKLPLDFHPLPYFREYLRKGYFPFSNQPGYDIRLQQVIAQTMEVDIPQFCSMNASTVRKLKKMLGIISASVPYKPNLTSLAVEVGVSKNDISEYLVYLEMAGMIGLLRNEAGGFRELGKIEKVYLDNPNLAYALKSDANIGSVRESFFYNQTRVGNEVFASKLSDFKISENIFEIGGIKKGKKQLAGEKGGIVVRDDIEYGVGIFVPLWEFGLMY